MQSLTLRRPDDWHVHLRDGPMLAMAVRWTAQAFRRAIVMPNLAPPIITHQQAAAYRNRIRQIMPEELAFEPLMTLFLTDETSPDDVAEGFATGVLTAVKMYPANSTTNSATGITNVTRTFPVLDRMQQLGMPLLIHGEVTDPEIDVFDRETVFIDEVLAPLLSAFPNLKVVIEHITTSDAVEFVRDSGYRLGATITAHHLMINRNAMFERGIRPHMYCLPVAKRERHRLALRKAATSGDARFFLGTDSAPHLIHNKESSCGCAGLFSAPVALELYAQIFEEAQALDRLEGFASLHGARFYGLPVNTETVTLEKDPWRPPRTASVEGQERVQVFCPPETLQWRRTRLFDSSN